MSNLDHWICIPDADLGYILEGPSNRDDIHVLKGWIDEVIEVIEDGLETA